MAQVTVTVNNRAYSVACDDGEEDHLRDLARYVDAQVGDLVRNVGQISESRLLLMGALLIADQLAEADERVEELKAQVAELQAEVDAAAKPKPPEPGHIEPADLARMLETATTRIEALAARLERT
jgi:cell division protein ZapA